MLARNTTFLASLSVACFALTASRGQGAMKFIANDPKELADYIRAQGQGLVAFDGRTGSGKTYLANQMAKLAQAIAVDADAFLLPDQGKFLEALKLDELRDRIRASFATSPLVLFSSVCARQVIDRLGVNATAHVWVERSSLACLEIDRRDFAGDHNADAPVSELHREIEAYIKVSDARGRPDVVYLNAPD
jgi:hypothetical protein